MAWTDPYKPNLQDFWAFCYQQGVPTAALPLPVASVSVAGSGYTDAPEVTISPPAIGTTMTATATVSGGGVTGLVIGNPGVNYADLPTVTIAPPLSGTQAVAAITSLGSVWPASVLNQSIDRTIDSTGGASIQGELSAYVNATYNLGFHLLLLLADDEPGQTFFATTRTKFDLTRFRPGIILASGDQATSQTFIVPKFMHELSMESLDATKTPWGRQWVGYQQMYGYTIWDMS